jgi:hypothetical protein
MRTAAVGQKCPTCARPAKSARALGKPEHYVRAIAAGLGAAVVGGVLYAQLIAALRGFGSLILSGVLGFVIGRVVNWGTRGQSQQPFSGIAIALGIFAIAIAFVVGYGTPVPPRPLALLAYPVAGWFALRGLQR